MVFTSKMRVVYGDASLGLHGQNFDYLFSYERHGLESLKINNKEWLYRVPTPTFWRATTDNDRGNGFNIRSSQWLASDMFQKGTSIDLTIDDHEYEDLPIAPLSNLFNNHEEAEKVRIAFNYETLTIPQARVTIAYLVKANGEIKVTMDYHGQKGLPSLPVLGMRMIMPTKAEFFEYDGLSGETYPDRLAGGIPGTYKIMGLPVTKYLVPQENGMHMQTRKLTITRNSTQNNADHSKAEFSLNIGQAESPFNFSCLPYTAEELENATHIEELPPARRTVLVIAGQVRGVGGIDSWGANVEPQYEIPADQNYSFSYIINKK